MMFAEENLPVTETPKIITGGVSFIGYGTKQMMQNNGWTTIRNLTQVADITDSVVQLSALEPVSLLEFPHVQNRNVLTLLLPVSSVDNSSLDNSSTVSFTGGISDENVKNLPLKRLSSTPIHDLVSSESTDLSVGTSVSEASAQDNEKTPDPDNVKMTPLRVLLSDNTGESPSLSMQTVNFNDSEKVNSDTDMQNTNRCEGENEIGNSKEQEVCDVDAVFSDNNNYKDLSTLESVKTDKAAARLQLNAVLQSEISKTMRPKVVDVVNKSSSEIRASFVIGRSNKLSSLSRTFPTQEPPILKPGLSQVVRIKNAKIVEVFETEQKIIKPIAQVTKQVSSIGGFVPTSTSLVSPPNVDEGENLAPVGHLELSKDIFKRPRPPHMIFSSLHSSNIVEAKTDSSVVHPQDFDSLDRGGDGKSFVFDPLCISADTLVPVAGTPGHGDRQSCVERAGNTCQQRSDSARSLSRDEVTDDSESMMFRCFLCPFFHTRQSKIAKHWISAHLRQLPYICSYCDKGFTTSWEVHKHIIKFHPGEKIKVSIKNSSHFASSLAYEVVKSDFVDCETPADAGTVVLASKDVHICKKCDFQCETSAELRSHQRSFHFKFKPYFCTYCTDKKLSFVCDFDLKQHVRAHHPERMLSMGRSFPDPVLPKLTADINWSSTYETISIANQVMFQCRTCAYRSILSESAWKHVLLNHNWPENVTCPSCANIFELSSADRESFTASCSKCQALMSLGPHTANVKPYDRGEPVYICTICDYKTMGKGSMNRHLKYNHTKCRPYGCVYCNYVAVERPKVKMHIESLHKGQRIAIKERTESSEGFRKLVEDLFSSIVRVGHYSELSDSVSAINIDDLNTENDVDVDGAGFGAKPRKRQKLGLLQDEDDENALYPFAPFELDAELALARDRDRKSISGEHFKCMICGYVCTDRSCMSRHIKYMHITSRPHSCPYCRYNNVEKTKVRLHVKSHHPNQPKCVKTNKKLLEDMSTEAKKFYIKVDGTGQVVKDSNSASLLTQLSDDLELDLCSSAQEGGDSIMDEFVLTELDAETDIIDVQTGEDGATVVLKEGVFQVGIKEEPTDDVEICEERGSRVPRAIDASIPSALDHNYVIDLREPVPLLSSDLSVSVKTEPEDNGYEITVEKLSPAVSSISVGRTSVDSNSELSDEDDDIDEDQSLVEIPLGATAANLDGLDSDEDDLDEDSDLDLLDFEGFDLHESQHLDFDMVMTLKKSYLHQVEQNRLQLLHQVQMEDDVRDDPKIWLQTVVSVEDIISSISANIPIMDI